MAASAHVVRRDFGLEAPVSAGDNRVRIGAPDKVIFIERKAEYTAVPRLFQLAQKSFKHQSAVSARGEVSGYEEMKGYLTNWTDGQFVAVARLTNISDPAEARSAPPQIRSSQTILSNLRSCAARFPASA